eukprot:scaffold247724_cov21-Prasinocladus_malaysianus.AAC.1
MRSSSPSISPGCTPAANVPVFNDVHWVIRLAGRDQQAAISVMRSKWKLPSGPVERCLVASLSPGNGQPGASEGVHQPPK